MIAPDERRPLGPTLALGAQHVVAMFGATVLAPLLMGFDPNVAYVRGNRAASALERGSEGMTARRSTRRDVPTIRFESIVARYEEGEPVPEAVFVVRRAALPVTSMH